MDAQLINVDGGYSPVRTNESDGEPLARDTRLPLWVTRRILPLAALLAVALGVHSLAGSSWQVAMPVNMNTAETDLYAMGEDTTAPTPETTAPPVPTGGEEVCEGHGFDAAECKGKDCCHWDGKLCMSAVGDKPCGAANAIRWATHPDKCFDITDGSTANGNNVQVYDCVEGSKNQQFQFPEGFVGPIHWGVHPHLCLDVTDGATVSNNIQLWECDATNANQAFHQDHGRIAWAAHPSKCLAVTANGENIEIAECSGSPNQVILGWGSNPIATTLSPTFPCATTQSPLTTQPLANPCATTQAPLTTQPPVNPCAMTQAPATTQAPVTTQAPADPCETTQAPVTTQAPANPCATTQASIISKIFR